jgi:hypothetical protein
MSFILIAPTEEDFSSQLNGATTDFALSALAVAGTLTVYLNGLRQAPDGEDYTVVDASNFTMVEAPEAGEVLRAVYLDQELVRFEAVVDREPEPPRFVRVGRRVIPLLD